MSFILAPDGGLPMVQDYRRRLNRAERRKAEKAGDGGGAALREAAEEAEFERAKVRPFAVIMLCVTRESVNSVHAAAAARIRAMLAAKQGPDFDCYLCTFQRAPVRWDCPPDICSDDRVCMWFRSG